MKGMRFVIAGSSGLIGTSLRQRLADEGHEVVRLVRREPTGADESAWDPRAGQVDLDVVASADVVVNVAGSPLVGNPFSDRWAARVRESRVGTTSTLARAIADVGGGPAFLAGNGSSVYGDHGAEPVTEESDSRGDALLTRVALEWEQATAPAAEAGARVCVLRTAPVADRRNPLYRLQLPIFRLGLGARLGDGRQYFPIVSMRDWVGAALHLATHPTASGPFNICCPRTPTNEEYTDALASLVGRRAFLAAPAPLLRLAGGKMAPELLNSINLVPAALQAAGYEFSDPDVESVLAAMLT